MIETLKKNIIYLRKKNKMSQAELAHIIGVNQATISLWEKSDKPSISFYALDLLAEAFQLSVSDLIGRDLSIEFEKENELESLLHQYIDILTEDDKDLIQYIVEQRKKKVWEKLKRKDRK